jgi:hypothetical protein
MLTGRQNLPFAKCCQGPVTYGQEQQGAFIVLFDSQPSKCREDAATGAAPLGEYFHHCGHGCATSSENWFVPYVTLRT